MIDVNQISAPVPNIPFDLKSVLLHAEQLVFWDEPLRALLVLNNLPGYYRDHEPKEVTELRHEILKSLHTAQTYINTTYDDVRGSDHNLWAMNNLARGMVIRDEIKKANEAEGFLNISEGFIPHIVDFGPGEYWMALGLRELELNFTYSAVALQKESYENAANNLGPEIFKRSIPDHKNLWFVAYEIIEHLKDEWEVAQEVARLPRAPRKIFLSTPRYTYAEGDNTLRFKWREGGLGHVRTYTPNEFITVAMKMFPNYKWTFYNNVVMVLLGELKD